MNISPAELMGHPLMRQVTADIAETKALRDAERIAAEMERARLRAEQGRLLQAQFDEAVADYERLRRQTHAAVGRVWSVAQAYSRLTASDHRTPTGRPPQGFAEQTLLTINLPTLKTDPSPWAVQHSITTTYSAVQGWFATQGKDWVG